jgi:hypothetical protein
MLLSPPLMAFEYLLSSSQEAGLDAEPDELGVHPLSLFSCVKKIKLSP